jgi:hypothetical protein
MLNIKVNKLEKELKAICGIAFNSPKVDVSFSINKIGKQKTTSKIKFDNVVIDLGITASIPEGLELIITPKPELFDKYGLIPVNSNLIYSGNDQKLSIQVIALTSTAINAGTEVATYSIRLSPNASLATRLKYLLFGCKFIEDGDAVNNI